MFLLCLAVLFSSETLSLNATMTHMPRLLLFVVRNKLSWSNNLRSSCRFGDFRLEQSSGIFHGQPMRSYIISLVEALHNSNRLAEIRNEDFSNHAPVWGLGGTLGLGLSPFDHFDAPAKFSSIQT